MNDTILTFKSIGDISDEGLFVYNTTTEKLDYVNSALTEIWDISHKSFSQELSFYVHHIIEEDVEYLKAKYETLKSCQKVENVEFRIRRHNNEGKDINASFYLIHHGRYVIGFVRDNTSSKQHEQYVINYGAKKDTILDQLTHSLNSPLTLSNKVVSSLELAVRENDTKRIETYFQLIKQALAESLDFIDDFLEEEHLVSEHIYAKPNRFDVVSKINSVLERYIKTDSHRFVFNSPVKSLYITNDDVKFFQIVNNLISNAIKFSGDDTTVTTTLSIYDTYVMVSVADEGIGIPDDLKGTLFQRHTPSGRPGLRGERSIGIGLYIIKKLLDVMGGSISYESKENSGSKFSITLPKDALDRLQNHSS